MTQFHGKLANVYWDCNGSDTELAHGQSWTLDITKDVVETTSFQDIWDTFLSGYVDWTASVTCNLDSGGLSVPLAAGGVEALGENTPAKIELYFKYDTVTPLYKCLYGSAICTGIAPNSSNTDVGKVTYNFKGNGVLTPYAGVAVPSYI